METQGDFAENIEVIVYEITPLFVSLISRLKIYHSAVIIFGTEIFFSSSGLKTIQPVNFIKYYIFIL
jgi:hypothetical protein